MSEASPPNLPGPPDAPLDAASQSLADALKASFRVLRAVMILLVVVFLCSGVTIVDNNEQAVILRFGKLLPEVRNPGLCVAFPFPIDQTLKVPTLKRNTLSIRSHWFHVRREDEGKPLRELAPTLGEGLHPTRHGALLTSDRGLVHVKWTLIYRIENLEKYVRNVADGVVGDVETLVTALLENAAVSHAATMTAEEITRTKTAALARVVRNEINEKLGVNHLDTGIVVESLEPEVTVPLQTLDAFTNVTRAESRKDTLVREAEKTANDILNKAAGEAYPRLIALLDQVEAARESGSVEEASRLEPEVDRLLEDEVAGIAGSQISRARSFYTEVVQEIEGDVEEYNSVLGEYQERPELLVSRLWEQTRRRVLSGTGVRKHFVPWGSKEIRLIVYPDPKEKEFAELEALRKEAVGKAAEDQELRMLVPPELLDVGR